MILTVEELIEKLKHVNRKYDVLVQYRDYGGEYNGQDNDIYFMVDDDRKCIIF